MTAGEDGVGSGENNGVAMAKLTLWAFLRARCSIPHALHFRDGPKHVQHGEVEVGILVAQHEEACRTR